MQKFRGYMIPSATRIKSESLYDFAATCPRCGKDLKRASRKAKDGLTLCKDCRDFPDEVWLGAYLGRETFRATTDEELAELEAS